MSDWTGALVMNDISPFMKLTNRPLRDNMKRSTSPKNGKFSQRGKGGLEAMSYSLDHMHGDNF